MEINRKFLARFTPSDLKTGSEFHRSYGYKELEEDFPYTLSILLPTIGKERDLETCIGLSQYTRVDESMRIVFWNRTREFIVSATKLRTYNFYTITCGEKSVKFYGIITIGRPVDDMLEIVQNGIVHCRVLKPR